VSFRKFEAFIVRTTEELLTGRKHRRIIKKDRPRRVHPVADWIVSIFIIILIVIIIQMLIFQNYRIPSGSMIPVLLEGDVIFVEKLSFGPEILPGKVKLPSFRKPDRGEVVSFESVDYAREGPLVELRDRFVYFITLSLVNLKKDENNREIVDLLIKRVIGLGGDRVRFYRDKFEILPDCEDRWMGEKTIMMENGKFYTRILGSFEHTLPFYKRPLFALLQKLLPYSQGMPDSYFTDFDRTSFQQNPCTSLPPERSPRVKWLKAKLGWYIPENMFFPLGDNRPISRDARVYGPVPISRIEGKALFRFFPFSRFGVIE
jgi:signal peptidase I